MTLSSPGAKVLYLDRRANVRINHHFTARFNPNADRPLRISRALTQNISMKGAQILSTVVPELRKTFEIWIPIEGDKIICAKARAVWSSVDDILGDSSYWVRLGLSFTIEEQYHKEELARAIAKKASLERTRQEQEASKIGFVF